jgi:hypothetical protein
MELFRIEFGRFTVYRLPRGDYSNEGVEFFENRGDYVADVKIGERMM